MQATSSELKNREILEGKARLWKVAKRASFAAPFVLSLVFYAEFRNQMVFSGDRLMFSLSTCAVALILAGTYFFTYKFFTENFYFFIFVSWIANAIYLVSDLNGPTLFSDHYFNFKLAISLLSLTSSVFLLLALLSGTKRRSPRSTWMAIVSAAIVLTGISYIAITKLPDGSRLESQLPDTDRQELQKNQKHLFPNNEHIRLAKLLLPAAPLSFILLCAVGSALKARLENENPGWKGPVLRDTFYIYASLQFFYPFTPYLSTQSEHWELLFLIAQLAKVGNAIAMIGVLQSAVSYRDFRSNEEIVAAQSEMRMKTAELQAQEEKLRHFVELGMLASAIKHDVQTPLATMGFDIEALKSRLQSENKSTKRLESLEDSMDRIEATVKVVDIFRGDKIFFDRDEWMRKASMLEIAQRAVRSVKNEREDLKENDAKVRLKVTGRPLWVRAYVPMLEQVLVNIIKNGLEAIEEAERDSGLITLNVSTATITGSEYARWVSVQIDDNGCGIAPENMDKLTTIFTTRGDKKPNSGIGLFIGKKVVDIHDGQLKFDSTVGVGTRVTLMLPEWKTLRTDKQVGESGSHPKFVESNEEDPLETKEIEGPAEPETEEQQAGIQTTPRTL